MIFLPKIVKIIMTEKKLFAIIRTVRKERDR